MQQEFTEDLDPGNRGRPKGRKDQRRRRSRRPLPESVTCDCCGLSFKPRTHEQRFCNQVCYHRWWRDAVRPKATRAGVACIRKAIEGGSGPQRDKAGRFYAEEPATRSRCAQFEQTDKLIGNPDLEEQDEGADWAERAEYWGSLHTAPKSRPTPFGPTLLPREPLVLNGHGVHLRIHQGSLVIRNGFTHYPQSNPELRFFRADPKLPSRIIVLDCDGAVSFDVIAWLSEQKVPLIVLNWQGEVVSVVVGDHGAYDPELRHAQLAGLGNANGLEIATQLIRLKIQASAETLQSLWKNSKRDMALMKLEQTLRELSMAPGSIEELRLLEGRAAFAYFASWQDQPIKWKGTGRKPIPAEWHRCGTRQGLLRTTNRHATHPLNALLNYSYGVLESELRIQAVARGFDPTIGYLHANKQNRLSFVYDLMEPLRPRADKCILSLLNSHTFSPADFVVGVRGVCRLHPELACSVARSLNFETQVTEIIARRIG